MTTSKVDVHELIAWDLDDYSYREAVAGFDSAELVSHVRRARIKLAERDRYMAAPALLEGEALDIQPLLAAASQQEDLQLEYKSLDWTLGVIDLRRLLAFQRRLIFDPARQGMRSTTRDDWPALLSLAVGSPRSTEHILVHHDSDADRLDISLHSSNPDLQLRFTPETNTHRNLPFSLYGGSPFFEVAELRGRWFLRDGYHRAYQLLRTGVDRVPAVVIYARSIEELGATAPWFFNEETLFSDHPPQVTDFIDNDMTLCYERTALRKVIRIRVEESLQPFDEIQAEQGERV